MTPRIGSLCSGYGGLDLGLMAAVGGSVAWHVEYDATTAEDVLNIIGKADLVLVPGVDAPGHCVVCGTRWYPRDLPCPSCEADS